MILGEGKINVIVLYSFEDIDDRVIRNDSRVNFAKMCIKKIVMIGQVHSARRMPAC